MTYIFRYTFPVGQLATASFQRTNGVGKIVVLCVVVVLQRIFSPTIGEQYSTKNEGSYSLDLTHTCGVVRHDSALCQPMKGSLEREETVI